MRTPHNIFLIELNLDGTPGGSYRSLLYLVKHLDRMRFNPIVAFYREHPILDEFHQTGCKTLLLEYPTPINLVNRYSILKSPVFKIVRLILLFVQKVYNFISVFISLFFRVLVLFHKEKIRLVHLNNGVGVAGIELLLAAKVLGIHCTVHQRGIHPVARWQRKLSGWMDHIICVSDAARDNLIANGIPSDKCTTVHNGIDQEDFFSKIKRDPDTVKKSLGISSHRPIVGIGAMIQEWKGQIVLLKAMHRLREKHPDLLCLIVGGVSDRDEQSKAYFGEIVEFIRKNGLTPWVRILGYEKNVGEVLQIFDVMVHASIDPEPFSRVVLEGMLLGRAIVGTSTGGTVEQIEHRISGILIPPNSPAELATQIDYLLRNPSVRENLGIQARQKVIRDFLIGPHVEGTERIFDAVLSRR